MAAACHRYAVLRSQLDELGYMQPLPKDAIRLVDKLLADLVKTTESLQYYKALSNSLTNERDTLLLGTQPYKQDNAKLICEVNELHLELIQLKEEYEYNKSKLESRIRHLSMLSQNLDSDKKHLEEKIRLLELECAEQTSELLILKGVQGRPSNKSSIKDGKLKRIPSKQTSRTSVLKTDSGISVTEKGSFKDISKVVQKCNDLERNMQKLLDDKQQQLESSDRMQKQIEMRDQEILRLNSLLKGGRPILALNRDYYHRRDSSKHTEPKASNNEIIELETLLQEAKIKQHETYAQNLELKEQNKRLEKELHEVDNIALNVEKECNENIERKKLMIQAIQDKLNLSLDRNRELDHQLMIVRRENEGLLSELKTFKDRQQGISRYVQTSSSEIGDFSKHTTNSHILNDDLLLKISELTDSNIKLQHKISELEGHIHNLSKMHSLSNRTKSMTSMNEISDHDQSMHSPLASVAQHSTYIPNLVDHTHCYAPHPESYARHTQHTFASWKRCMEHIPYIHEMKSPFCKEECICNKCLQSINRLIGRLGREKDVLHSDIIQLQTERDSLKGRLKLATEMQMSEHSRLQQNIIESQNRVYRLENEQKDFVKSCSNQESTIRNLERQCNELKEQLCLQEKDTSHHRLLYNQLKILHDQTERALSKMQQQLTNAENQLATSLDRTQVLEQEHIIVKDELKTTKTDLLNAKSSVDRSSKEMHSLMNDLDTKAEELDRYQKELQRKDIELLKLQNSTRDLKKKLDEALKKRDGAQNLVLKATTDAESFRKELETLRRDCEHYSHENRRLQDELTTATCDLRSTLRDLEDSKKESADLQQQLQQYVDRVRHAEDIITMKETERSELLEQFRSLSQEATVLETNNHTLESNMADNAIRLHVTGQRANDLETRIQEKETALQESQIEVSALRSRIVTLEAESEHFKQSLRRAKDDLAALRDVCVDLDKQKDSLAHESGRLHSDRCQTDQQIDELRSERDCLQQDLDRETSAKKGLEALLESSRREAIDQRLLVQELNREVGELRNKVQDLMSKLEIEREQVRRYQAQSHEYSVQVQELRRQITNQRYQMTQIDEERDYFTTL